jgi:outer membrane protein assembly factor BamE (lipoprotein component of BamABCDE complex)
MNFLKKRWYLVVPLLLVCFPLLMVLYISMSYGYGLEESWNCLQNMAKTDTKFRVGAYSEGRFVKVTPGMMGRDVFELLGMPLERNMPDDTRWSYSVAQNGSTYFHERVVMLDHGKVTGTLKRFHTPESK